MSTSPVSTPNVDAVAPVQPRGKAWSSVVTALIVLGFLAWSLTGLGVSAERIKQGIPKGGSILQMMLSHPDWTFLPKVLVGLEQSLQIAALGTVIAAILAVPFGALAARNLARLPGLPYVGKTLLNLIRTFPELILAIAFIKALGPGPFAGVLAVGVHSIGMIGKLYAERIETVDKGALEALSAAGASPIEVFRHGIVPEVLPDLVSYALYRFDLNVRSASVLGLVGAGGIGTLLVLQMNSQNWPAIGLILLGIIITVGCVDFFSAKLRARLT